MAVDDPKSHPALGFLTVLEHAQHGLMGGYLVLNPAGRPLEFHCTTPVKPNRAQQILYGPTLEPYLFGEQIGKSLVAKSSLEPLVICTDLRPVMALRGLVSTPVALVVADHVAESLRDSEFASRSDAATCSASPDASAAASEPMLRMPTVRLDAAHEGRPLLQIFQLGRNRLAVPPDRESDRAVILKRLGALEDLFDLSEPFGRIREALAEAQRR
jgi:hypothetical protein